MVRANRSLLNVQSGAVVALGETGLSGVVVEVPDEKHVVVRVGDEVKGQAVEHITFPANAIQQQPDGTLHATLDREQIQRVEQQQGLSAFAERKVIPLVEERLRIGRRTIPTHRVTIETTVDEHVEEVNEPVFSDDAHVRTVPMNQIIDAPAEIREEGDELIVPLMEEVIVVEKKLMLREELRISRKRSERREKQSFTLRREEANVKRVPE